MPRRSHDPAIASGDIRTRSPGAAMREARVSVEAEPGRMLVESPCLSVSKKVFGVGRRLGASRDSMTAATASALAERASWTSCRGRERLRRKVEPAIVAVVGLQFEAKIIASPAVRTVVLGSEPAPLVAMLLPTDRGVISFGICGGLAPGFCVIASSISDGTRAFATDKAWTKSLALSIPNAVIGPILGVDEPILEVTEKSRLHKRHGAVAVDMESHVAALAASVHGLPLVAVRAVADDAGCALMAVALAGRRADGSVNVAGVLAALGKQPRELAPLIRLAMRTGSARATLARLRPILRTDFRSF